MLGYLGAFGEVVADQSACVLVAASLPGGVGVGEVDRHLGGHRECGMAGASRCPRRRVRVPFIRSGNPVTWLIRASHTPSASLPLGRARMVTNRVVRSTRVIAAVSPVGADDEVSFPMPWDPPVGGLLGSVIETERSPRSGPCVPPDDVGVSGRFASSAAGSRAHAGSRHRVEPGPWIEASRLLHPAAAVPSTRPKGLISGFGPQPPRDLAGTPRACQVSHDPDFQHWIGVDLARLRATLTLVGRHIRAHRPIPTRYRVPGDLPPDH